MNWKKMSKWLISFILALSTILSNGEIFAEEMTEENKSTAEETEALLEAGEEETEQEGDGQVSVDESLLPDDSSSENEKNVETGDQIELEHNEQETDETSTIPEDDNEVSWENENIVPAEHEETEYVSTAETISGTCGDTISWEYNPETFVLFVSGTGNIPDYSSSADVPWSNYSDVILEVSVEDDITGIGNYAFAGLTVVTKITLSDTITKIGSRAFYNDTLLQWINIPDNTTIDSYAFAACTELTYITIGKNVTKQANAFNNF